MEFRNINVLVLEIYFTCEKLQLPLIVRTNKYFKFLSYFRMTLHVLFIAPVPTTPLSLSKSFPLGGIVKCGTDKKSWTNITKVSRVTAN